MENSMRKTYFKFNTEIYIDIEDTAVIIDFGNNKLYEVESSKVNILDNLTKGYSLEEIGVSSEYDLIIQMLNSSIGILVDYPVIFENFSTGFRDMSIDNLLQINNVVVELPFECDKSDCDLCNENSVYSCNMCQKRAFTNSIEYDEKKLKNFIGKNFILMTGSVLKKEKELKEWIHFFKKDVEAYTINLITNDDIMQIPSLLKYLESNEIHVCINIKEEDFIKNEKNFNTLNKEFINFNVITSDINIIANDKMPNSTFSIVNTKYIDFRNLINSNCFDIGRIDLSSSYQSCLINNIYIRSDGIIVPCKGLNKIKVGNISSSIIIDADKLSAVWSMSTQKIMGCNTCAYKSICNECRALDFKLLKTLDKKITCKYKGG